MTRDEEATIRARHARQKLMGEAVRTPGAPDVWWILDITMLLEEIDRLRARPGDGGAS